MTIVTQYPTSNSGAFGGGLTAPTNVYTAGGTVATGQVGPGPSPPTTRGLSYGTFGFDAVLSPFVKSFDSVLLEVAAQEQRNSPPLETNQGKTRAQPLIGGVPLTAHDEQNGTLITNQYDLTASRAWTRSDFLDANLLVTLSIIYVGSLTLVDAQFDFVRWVVDYTEGHPQRHAGVFYYPPVPV